MGRSKWAARAPPSALPAWLHEDMALTYTVLLPWCPPGPGRDIIVNGVSALLQNRPDMNTLVGLGATASFGVSCVAAAMPHLGWKTFFEEPAMLLGGCQELAPACIERKFAGGLSSGKQKLCLQQQSEPDLCNRCRCSHPDVLLWLLAGCWPAVGRQALC